MARPRRYFTHPPTWRHITLLQSRTTETLRPKETRKVWKTNQTTKTRTLPELQQSLANGSNTQESRIPATNLAVKHISHTRKLEVRYSPKRYPFESKSR
jgi:hypothetical protein